MKFSDIKKLKPAQDPPAPGVRAETEPAPAPQAPAAKAPVPERLRLRPGMSYTQLFMERFPALARKAAARMPAAGTAAKPQAARPAAPARRPAAQAPPARPPSGAARKDAARKAYGRAIAEVKVLLRDIALGPVSLKDGLGRAVGDCLDLLIEDNQDLVAMTAHSTAANYLYAHSVNVSILAMHVGMGFGWEKDALRRLGLAAVLEDFGMAKSLGLANEPRALSPEEQQEVRLHPIESLRLLEFIKDIEESTRRVLSEVLSARAPADSEAAEGETRSPEGATAAQIIALCEIYESLCHYRSWREPMLPHLAVKRLLKEQSQDFDRRLIQKFVERISLFPPGSFVELSSGEIACVVETHPKTPTLPTVELRLRGDETPAPATRVNLAENPLTHIKRAVDETKLPLKDKKTLLAFQAARWWVD